MVGLTLFNRYSLNVDALVARGNKRRKNEQDSSSESDSSAVARPPKKAKEEEQTDAGQDFSFIIRNEMNTDTVMYILSSFTIPGTTKPSK